MRTKKALRLIVEQDDDSRVLQQESRFQTVMFCARTEKETEAGAHAAEKHTHSTAFSLCCSGSPFWGSKTVASCQNVLRLQRFIWAGWALVSNTQQVQLSTGCISRYTNVSFDDFIQCGTICLRSVPHVGMCQTVYLLCAHVSRNGLSLYSDCGF